MLIFQICSWGPYHKYSRTYTFARNTAYMVCVDNEFVRYYFARCAKYTFDMNGRLLRTEIGHHPDFRGTIFRARYWELNPMRNPVPDRQTHIALRYLTHETLTDQEEMYAAAHDAFVKHNEQALNTYNAACRDQLRRHRRQLFWRRIFDKVLTSITCCKI